MVPDQVIKGVVETTTGIAHDASFCPGDDKTFSPGKRKFLHQHDTCSLVIRNRGEGISLDQLCPAFSWILRSMTGFIRAPKTRAVTAEVTTSAAR